MHKIATVVVKEIREALPAAVFFLFLFHMLALTRAVSLADYDMTALRATGATIGALIVAKAILLVDALPLARWCSAPRAVHVLWRTVVYGVVVLLFKLVEEAIPLLSEHGSLGATIRAMVREASWPILAVLALWIAGGLVLYSVAMELVDALGRERVRELLFGARPADPGSGGA